MKKTLKWVCILFTYLISISFGFGQNNKGIYYYYYNGEKRYLELNKDYVFISTVEFDSTQKNQFLKDLSRKMQKEVMSNVIKQKLNITKDFYWAEINLGTNLSDVTYNEKIAEIKGNENVQLVSPYYKSKDSKKLGLSNFFYVKLRTLADTIVLKEYSTKNKAIIVKQDSSMPLWFVLSCVKQTEKNALDLANKFFESRLFQFAEPDLMPENILNATDPYFPQQWGLQNTGQYGGTIGVDIKAVNAWKLSTGLVDVAVLDEGIQLTQPDLQGNINSLSYNTETGSSPSVEYGDHATAVAGILGAVDNIVGINGVAPQCKMMSISAIMNLATPHIREKLSYGIQWAWQIGAQVINNS